MAEAGPGRNDCLEMIWKRSVIYLFICLIVICSGFVKSDGSASCKIGDNYDLAPLVRWPWKVITTKNNIQTVYTIRLCNNTSKNDDQCPAGGSICRKEKNKSPVSVGNYTQKLDYKEDAAKAEIQLSFYGAPCPAAKGHNYTTVVHLKCGKTLGSPKFLESYACETYFEWYTSVACKTKPTAKEVPCSVYNKDGKKVDLTPLIKTVGAYRTETVGYSDFYINVCREITKGSIESLSKCKDGTSACQTSVQQVATMGRPAEGLKYDTHGRLTLQYTADPGDKPSSCTDDPSTTITFLCPKRGGGQNPKLTSSMDCQYQVLWETEYACPEETLISKTCQLSQAQHGVDIDLLPLRHGAGSSTPYIATSTSGGKTYSYYINVCEELGIDCPDSEHRDGIPVCQKSNSDASFGKVLGKLDHQILRYSDGELTLTYQSGDPCHDHFKRTTIITFHCNKSAENDGVGKPVFNSETKCTYLFDWDTKYACVSRPKMCHVQQDKKQFDLSGLMRTKNHNNWEALTSHLLKSDDSKSRYFINICGDLLKSNVTEKCPEGAAACTIDEKGVAKSLGQYVESPTYLHSGEIQLVYKNGSPCTGKTITSTITLICKPGDLESGPVLVHRSDNKCQYDFRWQTAAACVLGKKTGTNCRVFDDDAGFNFDLSRMTMTGTTAYYKADDPKYDYYINVCAPVNHPDCKGDTQSGACQVNKNNKNSVFSLGKASDTLYYYDGMINLTYTHGTPYNTVPKIPRKTEIIFLCDLDAGLGKPIFHKEGNHSYTFHWFTKYACAEPPLECVVTDPKTHQQYDLSSLSKSETQQNWAVTDHSKTAIKKFYLNVCRPVNPVHIKGTMCDAFAAACMSEFKNFQEEITIKNLGHALTAPTIETNTTGHILLTYTNGSDCTDDGGIKKKYITRIHLHCKQGGIESSPRLLEQIGQCEYSFLWETSAACPISSTDATKQEPCTIKDKNSDYVFNLQPLKKPSDNPYEVDGKYKLNICGKVDSCGLLNEKDTAACSIEGTTAPLSTVMSQKLQYSDDGAMTLTYEGGASKLIPGDRDKVIIRFTCDRNVPLGDVTFLRREGTAYLFQLKTSLVCPPQPVDCLVSDQHGNQYDLSPLAKTNDAYIVPDSRKTHSDLKYYINVCRPISSTTATTCPGGPVGGCQVSSSKPASSFGLGYIQSNPYAAIDGTLSLRYMNGALCHAGTALQNHRSTRILFFCSPTEHSPEFSEETPGCEYVFHWRTPAACAVQRHVGADCKVVDPLYHYHFDLNPLRNAVKDYHVRGNDYTFLLNVCGHLNEGTGECDGSKGVGACQTNPGKNIITNAGLANSKLVYNDGIITVEYKSGKSKCHGTYDRSTIIKFMCHHKQNGTEGPMYIQEKGDCTYIFEWPTSLACPPFQTGLQCSVQDPKGNVYDFSGLTQTNHNYEVTNPTMKGVKFFINICATVVHTQGSACPFNSAACMVNGTVTDIKKKYRNLGEVQEKMVTFENNQIKLTYTNGDTCKNGNKSRTIISMICRDTAYGTSPEFSNIDDDCDFYFNWVTVAACNKKIPSPTSSGDCKAKDPGTGYTFDLNSLTKVGAYTDHDTEGHSYKFNICGPVGGSNCTGGKAGVCQSEEHGEGRSWNLGDYNSNLTYDDGVLVLNYTNGERCHRNHYKRNTVISFVCGESEGKPVFIKETSEDCTYFIVWHTQLACEKRVQCSVDTPTSTIDLSPLIRQEGYYLALKNSAGKDPNATFYINICRPLNPIRGLLCPPGSGACRVAGTSKPVSIGKVSDAPTYEAGKVTLVYKTHEKCKKDPTKNITSRIIFNCEEGRSRGEPRLEDVYDDCEYVFSWGTNIVCEEKETKPLGECRFQDPVTDNKYDLSDLKKEMNSYEVTSGDNTYYLNLCGGVNGKGTTCKKSSVCMIGNDGKEVSFGLVSSQHAQVDKERITFTYKGGDTCSTSPTGDATSQIILECDPHAKQGKPKVLSKSPCSISFLWLTDLVCPPVMEKCSLSHKGNVYDLTILSREQGSWNVTDPDGNIYWINICQGLHVDGGKQCPPGAAVCRKVTDGTVDMLGKVDTQDLYMKDDGKLMLEYSDGSDACSHGKRRSDNTPAKVIIEFECAATVGGPVYMSGLNGAEDSCIFRFQWKSRLACKVERVPVKPVKGVVTDPRSGGQLDLTSLYSNGNNYYTIEKRGSRKFDYLFSLEGKLALDTNGKAKCTDAVVCREDASLEVRYSNLGAYNQRVYYMEDDVLEGVFTSSQTCDVDTSKKFQSIIVFHCDHDLENQFKRMNPVFTYKSKCVYLFDWYTIHACVTPKVIVVPVQPKPGAAGHGSITYGKTKPSTIGAIVGVFSVIIILCVLVLVFHKKERRAAFRVKVRMLFKKPKTRTVKYSVLAQGEDDEFLIGGSTADDDPEDEIEITNGTVPVTLEAPPVTPYHDDSDEDLLE